MPLFHRKPFLRLKSLILELVLDNEIMFNPSLDGEKSYVG